MTYEQSVQDHAVSMQRTAADDAEGVATLASEHPELYYAAMHEKCPFSHNADGTVTALRMADINAVTRSRDVLGNGGRGPSMGGTRPLIPLDLDGPEHTKYRKLLDPLFSPKRVALMEPTIRERARALIDKFVDLGEIDIFEEYCEPLPSSIFLGIMGLPQEDLEFFLSFKNGILKHDPSKGLEQIMADIMAASAKCYAYFEPVLEERSSRADPGEDLLGWLVTTSVDGHTLSREEELDIVYLLMIAGLDTVGSSMACLITWFARNPDRRQEVLDDPSLWPAVVEELMRFTSPVTTGHRYPQVDMEIGGEKVAAGQQVIVSWAGANLDPEMFDDPLTVNFHRESNPHIGFASGFHRCLGSHLARLEIRVALEELLTRIPDFRIRDGHSVQFTHNPRTPTNGLPLVWG
ncbi:MAG TPA: cytochrome P450 [Ilumatobacter sp.]|nr:cytochrome P450 [Ilumatobacter sp.]